MKASIIAEGRSDQAVLLNILKGKLGIHRSDVRLDVPEYELDQTDMAQMDPKSFSNWTIVKTSCCERYKIDSFLEVNPDAFVVLQIDTAERIEKEYNVLDPQKTKSDLPVYSDQLRINVISKINEWIGDPVPDRIAYAIAIEETEAWLLTLTGERDTEKHNRPKEVYFNLLNKSVSEKIRKKIFAQGIFQMYDNFSRPLSKHKSLLQACLLNISLQKFCEDLDRLSPRIDQSKTL